MNFSLDPPPSARATLAAAVAVVTVAAGALLGASPAAAATPVSIIDAATVGTYKLQTDPAEWATFEQRIAAVEGGGAVSTASTLDVALSGQQTGRKGLCHYPNLLPTKYVPDGFCWNTTDDRSSNYSKTGGWVPQGLTASHDGDNVNGMIDGNHIYLASWYWGINESKNEFTRISMTANSAVGNSYGHVLLVAPTESGFEAVKGNHADGITWYGNRLFVANSGELQVYDMRHIWRMNSLGTDVGISGGTSSAWGHQWVMPMIGRYWTRTKGSGSCQTTTGATPCFSSLSLDRTGTDGLIAAEWKSGAAGGRIIRWPLNASTALPRADDGSAYGTVTAVAGYSSPIWEMQGAATDGTNLYISGRCPDSANEDPNSADAYSCIHRAVPGQEPHVIALTPPLSQNLSFSRFSGRLWGLNERIDSVVGKRVVFSIDVTP
ncbi:MULTISPECIES: hypothetical protein [Actinoplanes]|uniref:hypothetical protein n=1 Tax=Actinoplanes TaxID=1865 RepID=UPI000697DA35|nr:MULTISPECIES: hypothetical protein [Actinoplanes]GLY05656.1 hypothetical protein Acsp01_60350 [Actinoplanes sp. NBRC 101535]